MKRSVILSLLIIGAAASFLGAGTFATFTSSDSDTGVLKAASLAIDVQGSGASLAFSGSGGHCPDALLPGDSCSDTVTVTNNGGFPVTVTAVTTAESGGLDACGDGDSLTTTTSPNIVGTTLSASGGSTSFTISSVFDATATSDCQGKSSVVQVTVTAEAS